MKLVYPACFYEEEDEGFSVEIPDLLGCCTQGENLEEAIQMAQDAALGRLLTAVSIPVWLNERAERLKINFSQTLQDALLSQVLKNRK